MLPTQPEASAAAELEAGATGRLELRGSRSLRATRRAELAATRTRTTLLLLAILLLAAALRLYQVTQPYTDAFGWRQSSTAMIAENFYRTSWNIFYPEVNWTGPGPNYQGREFQTVSYVAALLYTLLGQQDWVARSVAIGFGLWGIVALFLLVRRVWDEQRALLAAALMAVLPGSVFIERSLLPDPAMVALGTTAVWLWIAFLQDGGRRVLVLGGLIGAWAFATKIPGLILGLPMLYALLAIRDPDAWARRETLAAAATFAALTLLPVIGYYFWARHLALSYPPNHFAGAGNWVWVDGFGAWIRRYYFLPELAHHLWTWLWTLPAALLLVGGLLLAPPPPATGEPASARRCSGRWLFHWWLAAGLIYYLVGARELVHNPWNLHVVNPAVAALAAHALLTLGLALGRVTSRSVAPAVIALALLALLVAGRQGLRWMYRPYFAAGHSLGLALEQVTRPGDLVVTLSAHHADPVALYYSRRRGWVFPPLQPGNRWEAIPRDDSRAIEILDSLRQTGAGWLGLVEEHRQELWSRAQLAAHLHDTCTPVAATEAWYVCRFVPVSPAEPRPR